jgi:hypothetical protein
MESCGTGMSVGHRRAAAASLDVFLGLAFGLTSRSHLRLSPNSRVCVGRNCTSVGGDRLARKNTPDAIRSEAQVHSQMASARRGG